MEKTINTIIIQVTKLAGKKADDIIILNEMKCVYNNKNNGLAINVINNRLNISNDWKKKKKTRQHNSQNRCPSQTTLTTFGILVMTQSSLVESSCLVEWSSPSRPLRVIPSSSHPRWVVLVESTCLRQVMVPHRVILGESSCVIE